MVSFSALIKPSILVLVAFAVVGCSATGGKTTRSGVASVVTTVPATSAGPASVPAAPARGGTVTAESAVQSALAYNPSIRQANAKALGSNAVIEIAKAGYAPSIQTGVNSQHQKGSTRGWQPKLDVSVSQMVFDFGKVSSQVDASTARFDADRADYLLAQDRVARDTLEAFIETQRYMRLVAAAEQKIRGISAIADLVNERISAGASTRSDEMEARSRVQAATTNRLEISSVYEQWRATLMSLTGISNVRTASASPNWLEGACSGVQPNWSASPAIVSAEARKREAEATFRNEQAQLFPSLVLEGGASYDVAGTGAFEDHVDYRVGLSVKSKVFNGFSGGAAVTAAGYATQGAEAAVEASRIEAATALAGAQSQVGALRAMVSQLGERKATLIESRDLYQKQYAELGTRTLLDLFQSEEQIHQSDFDVINARADLLKLGVVCLYSSGNQRAKLGYAD